MNCESVAPSHAKTIGTNFALKSFHAIINLVSKLWNTIEIPLRILYFTPNFTDMLFSVGSFFFIPLAVGLIFDVLNDPLFSDF